MATKKKAPRQPTTNGVPAIDPAEKEPKPRRMTKAQRERRIQALQEQVARLKAMAEEIQGPQEWHKLIGLHADDPEAFEEAMRSRSGVARIVPARAGATEIVVCRS